MQNKTFVISAFWLIASMVLGACRSVPTLTVTPEATLAPTATPPIQAPQTPEPTPAPVDKVQIRWFVGLGTGSRLDQLDAHKAIVEEFNASQDKIELVMEVVDFDIARDALSTEIASGNAPDIVGPVGWLGSNAFYDQWLDISDLITKNNYDTSDFEQATVKMYPTEEETTGIPFAVYPAALYYQEKIFDDAGLNYPPATYDQEYVMPDGSEVLWNWDTLTELAKLLTVDINRKNATQAGFDRHHIAQYGYDPIYQDLFHFAGYWGSQKPYTGNAKGSYKANIPDNWKASWKWWFDGIWGPQPFIPTGPVENSADLGLGNAFKSGKVAMAITHSWYINYAGGPGNKWDLGILPADAQGVVHGRVDADTFRIMKTTRHADEAFTVLTYLLGPAAPKLLITYGAMPARKSLLQQWSTDLAATHPWVKNWNVFTLDMTYPDIPSNEGYMPNFNEAWNRTVTFKTLLQTDGTVDYEAEYDKFVEDLTTIFNK